MWGRFWKAGGHYLIGLAGIAAVSTMAVVGVVTGSVAVPVVTGIVTTLIGGGIVHAGTTPTGGTTTG